MLKKHREVVRDVWADVCDLCGAAETVGAKTITLKEGESVAGVVGALTEGKGWLHAGAYSLCPSCRAAIVAALG